MSAIGVSPCPPFVHNNLVPGVLYDGNTVAWYKHNDPVAGVIKDGANRVSFWLDKYNYSVGAELVDQANWYTAAYWNAFDANWSQVGNTLLSTGGASGNLRKNGFWTIGSTYLITITFEKAAGPGVNALLFPYDETNIGIQSTLITGPPIVYSYYYTPIAGINMQIRAPGGGVGIDGIISSLSIKQVTGKHLLQATAASQPLWSAANGVLFDGINNFMKATAFPFAQPEMVYFVGRQVTWGDNNRFFDGGAIYTGVAYSEGLSPNIRIYAGIALNINNNFIVNTFCVNRFLFSGVNSFIKVNLTASIIGNAGNLNMDGFTLAARGVGTENSNIEVKEIILRKSADNAATQDAIYNYLKNINSV